MAAKFTCDWISPIFLGIISCLKLESHFRQVADFAHFVVREVGERRARQESILQSIDDQMARHLLSLLISIYFQGWEDFLLFYLTLGRDAVTEMRKKEVAATTTLLNNGEQVLLQFQQITATRF